MKGSAAHTTTALSTSVLFAGGFEVTLVRKNIRSVRLKVTPQGDVKVSAPSWVSDADVVSMVESRKSWIEEQQRAFRDSPQAQAETASAEERRAWRAVVEASAVPLIAAWEPILGVRAKKIVYRNMKSRWGSCQPSTGRICLNTRLALYPPECLEYVVVHELCHLLVSGHGSDFKGLLDRVMPDWRSRSDKLRW